MPPKQPMTFQDLVEAVQRLQELVLSRPRLHRKDLMTRYGISEATLHRLLRRHKLPRPVRFSGPLWRLEDLEAAEKAGQLPCPVSS
ncbi:MAG: helix-turn-helix transcriptional regulator [Limisphaerales bacterium]